MVIPRAIPLLAFYISSTAFAANGVQSVMVANNDVPVPDDPAIDYLGNTVTFYSLDSSGSVAGKTIVTTGGTGIAGGTFASQRLAIVPQGTGVCVFASNAGTNTITGIGGDYSVTGSFFASASDDGTANGIGLIADNQYLYAAYSKSSTIATFSIQPGCLLSYVSDVLAVGLNGGLVTGMAVYATTLVVTYGDGSISSFNVSGGAPLSNGDIENAAGSKKDQLPGGVTITADGRYALFADASTVTSVDVADISTGKLSRTITYELGAAWNSGNIILSPDQKLIFTTNNSGGAITAAFFDRKTGKITPGCTSGALKGFYSNWAYAGGAALQLSTGAGGLIYVPEFGSNGFSSIGVVQLTTAGTACTLRELATSPIVDGDNPASVLSIGIYPITPAAAN